MNLPFFGQHAGPTGFAPAPMSQLQHLQQSGPEPANITVLDKNSDVWLSVGPVSPIDSTTAHLFQCCSRTLARCSPVFTRLMTETDEYGNTRHMSWHPSLPIRVIHLPDEETDAMAAFLGLLHNNVTQPFAAQYDVDDSPALNYIYNMIKLGIRYECLPALRPWLAVWGADVGAYAQDSELLGEIGNACVLTAIAWDLGFHVLFGTLMTYLIKNATGDDDVDEEPGQGFYRVVRDILPVQVQSKCFVAGNIFSRRPRTCSGTASIISVHITDLFLEVAVAVARKNLMSAGLDPYIQLSRSRRMDSPISPAEIASPVSPGFLRPRAYQQTHYGQFPLGDDTTPLLRRFRRASPLGMCEILSERVEDWGDQLDSESLRNRVNAGINLMQEPWNRVRRYQYVPSAEEEEMMENRRNEIGVEGYSYAGELHNGWAYSDEAQGLYRR